MNIGLPAQERSEILPSDRPASCPLFPPSPAKVYQVSTPRDVHQLHHAIATEFSQTNKFEDWATRYAMEKLANSATAALHERDDIQKRLRVEFKTDERKRAKDSRNHVVKFLRKVCNLPIMQNFRRIPQGTALGTWPTPITSSPCKTRPRSWRKEPQSLLPS